MGALKRQVIMMGLMVAFAGGVYVGIKVGDSPFFRTVSQAYGEIMIPAKPTARVAITPAELARMIDDGEITVEIDGEDYIVFIGDDQLDADIRQAADGADEDARHQAVQDAIVSAMPRKPPKSLQPEADDAATAAPAGGATEQLDLGPLQSILGGLGLDASGGSMGENASEIIRQAMEQAQRQTSGE